MRKMRALGERDFLGIIDLRAKNLKIKENRSA